MRLLDVPVLNAAMTDEHEAFLNRAVHFFQGLSSRDIGQAPEGYIGREIWTEMGAAGLLGVSLPKERGGQGLGALGSILLNIACSEMPDCGLALALHVQNEVALHWLQISNNKRLFETWSGQLVRGEAVACTCDTDDSEVTPTTAELVDGRYRISGRKMFIVNGFHSDICMTTCIERLTGARLTILVEKSTSGVTVEHCFDKRGSRLIDSAAIRFDDVEVPAENVVVRPGPANLIAWNRVITRARFFVILDAYLMLGHAIAAIQKHAETRVVAGRKLIEWPVNRRALVRAMSSHAVIRNAIGHYYPLVEAGRNIAFDIARLKSYAIDAAAEHLRSLIDLEGARGYMNDSRVLQAYNQLTGLRQSSGSQATMLSLHEADPSFWTENTAA